MSSASDPALEFTVPDEQAGIRLDTFLAERVAGCSRSAITAAIKSGHASVDGGPCKPALKLQPGQHVTFRPPEPAVTGPQPEAIPLDILYEDEALVAVNKPAAMVVHPAKGHWSGTLTAALAHHFGQLSTVGGPTRPGIVHRLDRDTSGVILVAKNDAAHMHLAAQFEARTVSKQYLAVVRGAPERDRDIIDQPIGVHPYQREKMAIRANHTTSRTAQTQFEVVQRFRAAAVVGAFPKTGRTHQIRIHLAHIGHPVLCDRLYAGHARLTETEIRQLASPDARRYVDANLAIGAPTIDRQALHARRIEFAHPTSETRMSIEAPLAGDLQQLINILTEEHKRS